MTNDAVKETKTDDKAAVTMKPVLLDAACDVGDFASGDPTRYGINGVHVTANGVEATDGRIALRVPFSLIDSENFPPIAGTSNERVDANIPLAPLREALKQAAKGKSSIPALNMVRFSTTAAGDKAQLATTDLDNERVINAKVIDGQFPKIDQVWPTEEPSLSICLSAELLVKICAWSVKHGQTDSEGNTSIRFDFIDNLSCVRFSVRLEDGRDAKGVLMPMRMS